MEETETHKKNKKNDWMPTEWKSKRLKDVCLFRNGKGHEKLVNPKGEFVLVNSRFVSTEGKIAKNVTQNLSPLEINEIAIVMSDVPNGRAISKCFLVDKNNYYSLNQRIGGIKPLDINYKYLYYVINQNKYYLKFDDGITQTNLRKNEVLNCPIPYPPLKEQQKIAQILTQWDEAIETTQNLIEKLQVRKKGLMQELLSGKKRLAGFSEEWDLTELKPHLIKHSEVSTESGQYPVLTSSRKGIFFQTDYYTREVASKDNTGYNVVPRGYFTYRHMSDDLIFKFNINTLCDKGIVSTLYPVFTTKDTLEKQYLLSVLNEGEEFKRYALKQKQGGSRTYMYFGKLEKLKIPLPKIEEQKAIINFINALKDEINGYNNLLRAQEEQKKGLMQQLLTGKKRVKID